LKKILYTNIYNLYTNIYNHVQLYTNIYNHYLQIYVEKIMIRFKLMMLELEKRDLEMI